MYSTGMYAASDKHYKLISVGLKVKTPLCYSEYNIKSIS